jgi:LAO/AO transport system kinase
MRNVKESGVFAERRRQQTLAWVYAMVEDYLKQKFYGCGAVEQARPGMESRVISGDVSATEAAAELIRIFESAAG